MEALHFYKPFEKSGKENCEDYKRSTLLWFHTNAAYVRKNAALGTGLVLLRGHMERL